MPIQQADYPEVLQKIDENVGIQNFKDLCHSIYEQASVIKEHHTENVFLSQTYLFSIGQGEGLTSNTRSFAKLLNAVGLLPEDDVWERWTFPPYQSEKDDAEMSKLAGTMDEGSENAKGIVIVYDISGWVGHTATKGFRKLLMKIFLNKRKSVTIFRVPVIPENLLQQTEEDLSDILSVKTVVFPPFTSEEQHVLAKRILSEYGMTAEKSVWELFDEKIAEEKADGKFYGVHTIRKTVNEMIRCVEINDAKESTVSKRLTPRKLEGFQVRKKVITTNGEEELNSLIGLSQVKEDVLGIVQQIELAQKRKKGKRPSMHMCFTGNPGTGKTTVARILGNILRERGLLRVGRFFEYRGRELCGQYTGETAPLTKRICEEAYGSVLFIDEAYSLYKKDNQWDFGKEALVTLIAEMENHSEDLIVIFAGYPDDMEEMLSGNSGMRSRIPYRLEFPDYSREELYEIFMKSIPEEYDFDNEFADTAKLYFKNLPDEVFNKEFGNARFVRNLYERMQGKALVRMSYTEEPQKKLLAGDFVSAAREIDRNTVKAEKRKIGF